MASPSRDGNDLVITLSTSERVEALGANAEVRIPISAIHEVEVIDDPIHEIHGLSPRNFKVTGTYFPGKLAVGTFLDGSLKTRLFAAVHSDEPRGVRIRLQGTEFNDIILSLDNPEIVSQLIKGETPQ